MRKSAGFYRDRYQAAAADRRPPELPEAPEEKKPPPLEPWHCTWCGRPNPIGTQVCEFCGMIKTE